MLYVVPGKLGILFGTHTPTPFALLRVNYVQMRISTEVWPANGPFLNARASSKPFQAEENLTGRE